jgi:O-antigen ligase
MPSESRLQVETGLAIWTRSEEARRAADTASLDRWLARLGALILIVALLYIFIGPTPYDHELVLDPETGGGVMSPINRIIWLVLFGFCAPILWFRRLELPAVVRRLWPVLLLYGWFAASLVWSLDPVAAQRRLFLFVVDLTIAVALSLSFRDGRQFHRAMAWACALMVAIDLGSWIVMPAESMTDLGLAAIHTHKNTLGSVMLLSSMICGSHVLSQRRLVGRIFWSVVLVAAMILLAASRSKTSQAVFVAVALFAPILIWMLRQSTRVLWGVAASALVALVFAYLAWCYTQALDPLEPVQGLTFTQRKDIWLFVIDQIKLHPWRGLGFGSFWDIDPRLQPSLQTDEWFAHPDSPTNEAHDGYLDLWVTTGLIGLIGALIVLARWTSRAVARLRQALISERTEDADRRPYTLYQALFLLMFVGHNLLESSYFTANAALGLMVLLDGVDIDLRGGRLNR